jgi:hypothetical protein
MKANDRYLKFVFLTGITKFSKASIFSGLNNITDISLDDDYSTICGYTQENIENEFLPYLKNVDLSQVKLWYNGYNFLGDKVYNPFDILKFIKGKFKFENYWWESGNSFSLIEILKKGNHFLPSLQNLTIDKTILNSFDVEKLQIESLLFQAGYLTINKVFDDGFGIEYSLKVPNMEIQISLNKLIIMYLTEKVNLIKMRDLRNNMINLELEDIKITLISLFSSIANDNFRNNNIIHFEGYYASVIYAYFAGCGVELIAEDVTNRGRIDLTLKIKDNIYIVEFKMGKNNGLKQIKDREYHLKYISSKKNIYIIGISFDEDKRNIGSFEWEKVV